MMLKYCNYKISELAQITGVTSPLISRHFKDKDNEHIIRKNNRVIGLMPEAVEEYLISSGVMPFQSSITLSANLCGGVGKTTSIYNLGIALRRITNRKTPIIYIDGDSQASFTSIIFGEPAEDKEPILIDFFERKASVDDILTHIKDNIWFIKSNLNQVWLEKTLSKPKEVKEGVLNLYKELFRKFGKKIHIFQDHTPQLSALFSSSICALHQLGSDVIKSVVIPIRSDKFAIQGGDYIIKEMDEIKETFSFNGDIKIHCFFSTIDRRISTTADAFKLAKSHKNIIDNLSSLVIRYCSEVPKSIMSNSNVYSKSASNNAAEDYQDLLLSIFNKNNSV